MVAAEGVVVTPDAGGALGLLWLIPAVPLAVAFVNLFVGRRLGRWSGWLATLAVAVSFVISAAAVAALLGLPA